MRPLAPLLLLLAAAAGAEPVAVGTQLAPLALADQHDVRAEVSNVARVLLFTRDMGGGNLVKEALTDRDQRFLDDRRAVYVADISRMPALVSRLMALPRMRRRGYRVLLDRDGQATRDLPWVEGKVTLVGLDDLRVTRVAHLASVDEVRAALEGAAP